MHSSQADPAQKGGRRAAGTDPAKRAQIIEGAHRVFSRLGFDAASMNDITREAGVSKGTIYVYFSGKEDLFEALMEVERDRLFQDIEALLEGIDPIEVKLTRYARRAVTILCSAEVIRALRVLIGTAERMPELGARFYEKGGQRAQRTLKRFFEAEVAAGRLAIPDVHLAAYQFAELSSAGLWRRRLFAHMPEPPAQEEIDACVESAVQVFLAAYAVR